MPPNVEGALKPTSSVMISSTLGAPLGGTTRWGQYGVDCIALRSIFPPKACGGGGSCPPASVMVALGEPGVPEIAAPVRLVSCPAVPTVPLVAWLSLVDFEHETTLSAPLSTHEMAPSAFMPTLSFRTEQHIDAWGSPQENPRLSVGDEVLQRGVRL